MGEKWLFENTFSSTICRIKLRYEYSISSFFQKKYLNNVNLFFLFISAINSTVDLLDSEGLTCKGYVVDISSREQVSEVAKRVKEEIGNVDILINNAGIVCCKPLWDLPEKVIEKTYSVNILSHYWVS